MKQIVKSAIVAASLAGLGVAFAPAGHAQGTTTVPVQKPFRLKIGAAFPSSGDDKGGKLSLGADYDLSKNTGTNPTIYNLYVDYYGTGSHNAGGIGVGLRHLTGSALSSAQPYVGAGVGVYTTKVNGSSNKTNFGGKVLAGYQFNEGFFGEVDYTILGKNNGQNPSALGLRVGYRF